MSGVNWPIPPQPNETVRQYLQRYEETVEQYLARGGKIVQCPPPEECLDLSLRTPPPKGISFGRPSISSPNLAPATREDLPW